MTKQVQSENQQKNLFCVKSKGNFISASIVVFKFDRLTGHSYLVVDNNRHDFGANTEKVDSKQCKNSWKGEGLSPV